MTGPHHLRVSPGGLYHEGRKKKWRLLGEGMFSVAYRELEGERRVYIVTHAEAHDKEALALAHARAPENPHIPAVVRVGELAGGERVYVMPYYRPIRSWAGAAEEAHDSYVAIMGATWPDEPLPDDGLEPLPVVLARYEQISVPEDVKEALREILRAGMAVSDKLAVEIAHRNVALDEHGRLVLLDLLYDPDLGAKLATKVLEGES